MFSIKDFSRKLLFLNCVGCLINSLLAEYPKYRLPDSIERVRLKSLPSGGTYYDFNTAGQMTANSILELGSRDALDALKLSERYHCHVFAFECNPEALAVCKRNIAGNPNVTLVPLAVWNQTGPLSFYPMMQVPGVFFNPGSSSCFMVSKDGPQKSYVQNKITVQATRLDEWLMSQKIDAIDFICMDVEGAAYQALEGMGKYLEKVKYIIVEIEHVKTYDGEMLYPHVERFLNEKGFKRYLGLVNMHFGDYLFIRKDIIRSWGEMYYD